jgi:rod shape-determining protein MreB
MKTRLEKLLSYDIAIDLGSYKTVLYVRGEGVVLRQPTLITLARSRKNQTSVIAAGEKSLQIFGREPAGVHTIRPLQGGVIEQMEAARLLLKQFFATAGLSRRFHNKPNILISAPFAVSEIELNAVKNVARQLEARKIEIVEEPIASAIGAGLDIAESRACMVVDAGCGITEAALIALGGIVHCESERIGGETIIHAIIDFFKKEHGLLIGYRSAESMRNLLNSAAPGSSVSISVSGIDTVTRLPRKREFEASALKHMIRTPLDAIARTVMRTLENAPPMIAADLIDQGIVLTGGVAQEKGLQEKIEQQTGLPVTVAPDPANCVIQGAGMILEYLPF